MADALQHELINKYRESIAHRYNFDTIKGDPKMPKSFNRKLVHELRDFFLDNLYTEPKKRDKLDAAFRQLESYVSQPAKIWGLLGNLASAVFQFGLQFPAALRLGMVTLKTYTTARSFEDKLYQTAKERGLTAPLSEKEFDACLASLPQQDLEAFIDELGGWFTAIANPVLLQKTILILRNVHTRMKQKKNLYGKADTDAIMLGIDILNKGHELLSQYDAATLKEIVAYITYAETKFMRQVHGMDKK